VQAGSIVPGGVERLRFVNRREGWLFRPGLFSTHNGGQSWTEHQLDGEVVTLAATAESVWLIERRCSPTRPDLCELLLMVTASDGSVWHPAQVQPPLQGNMAHLVRSGEHHAWIMHADGLAATHDGGKSWSTLALPCQTQQSQVAAALAASSSSELWLLCHGERVGSSMAKYLYSSGNGGQQWDLTAAAPLIPDDAPINNLPLAGFANDLAVTSASRIFLAVVRNTLFASSDGGQSWSAAIAPRPAWDFAEAGGIWRVVFADSLHGWAVGTALADQFVFRTSDGGSAWDIVARLPLGEVRPPPDTCQPDTGHPAEDICAPLYPTSSGPPGFRDS
jgi:photosystem II stability/assembly factor-like uncharacterized protein